MQLYTFVIDGLDIGVTAHDEHGYHVSIDGNYVGTIFTEFRDEPPYLEWKTRDLIAQDLVDKIGEAIEDEDE